MTPDQFRRRALALPGAIESSHMNKPDFRAGGKIFATLGYPKEGWAMVNLDPEEALAVTAAHPEVFVPAAGAWGRGGSTTIHLAKASVADVGIALASAHERASARAKIAAKPRRKPPSP